MSRAKKPRTGRPPIPAEDRRNFAIRVLMTRAEHDEVQRAADAASMSVSTFCRAVALERARAK